MTVTRPHPDTYLRELADIIETLEAWNDPRTATGTIGGGKPESRPPGRAQCDCAVRAATDELERCCKRLRSIRDGAQIHQHVERVDNIGDVETDLPETIEAQKRISAKRDERGHFTGGVTVTHLSARISATLDTVTRE